MNQNKGIKKYLMFNLGGQKYAILLSTVKEVLALPNFTQVPSAPENVLGLINLRGKVVSAIDLKVCLNLEKKELDQIKRPSLIMIEIDSSPLAFLVDSIEEVISFDEQQIEKMNSVTPTENNHFSGVARSKGNEMILLINIEGLPVISPNHSGFKSNDKSNDKSDDSSSEKVTAA